MTPPPTLRPGKLCYLEIPARDVQQSAAFYERAFGWNIRFRDTDRPSFDDTTGEVSGAWVLDRTPDPDPGILPYIMVADAASAADAVVDAGGQIVLPVSRYGTEVLATFLDPAGNLLGLYQQPGLAEQESVDSSSPPQWRRISSGSPFEASIGFSRAVRVDDRILVAGTGPIWADGSCPDDPGAQARRCFDIIATALREAGADLADVVRTRMFLTSASDADAVGLVHGELFATTRPAATMIVVAALLDPRWKVEIEAEAIVGGRP